MPTRMILELQSIDRPQVTIHLDAMLLHHVSAGCYISPGWLSKQNETDPFTEVGHKLREKLETLSGLHGLHVMYGQYGFVARVPEAFDLVDVLFDILLMATIALDDDIVFGVTLGEDAFTKPEFATNPDRRMFGANIDAMLDELRRRKSREVIEAEQTIERLIRTLEESRR